MSKSSKGRLLLLTGISGSGKSTLGVLLTEHLNKFGVRPAFLLDGDMARSFFENDLSHVPDDRVKMSRRMAFGAKTLVENNVDVVMSNIAAEEKTRKFISSKFSDFIEIYMKIDVTVAVDKDVKGIYEDNKQNHKPNLVGLDFVCYLHKCP